MRDLKSWNYLIKEGFVPQGDELVPRFPFGKMTGKFGIGYIEYLTADYAANVLSGFMSSGDWAFSRGVPRGFINSKITPDSTQLEVYVVDYTL